METTSASSSIGEGAGDGACATGWTRVATGAARVGDEIGALAEVLAMTHQLQWAQRRGGGELWLGQRWSERLRITAEEERLDRHHIPLHREGAKQQVGEAPGLRCLRVGVAMVG